MYPGNICSFEMIWSHAALILKANHAQLSENIASGNMFVIEDLHLLRKHYGELTKDKENLLSLEELVIPVLDEEIETNVGQGLFGINC